MLSPNSIRKTLDDSLAVFAPTADQRYMLGPDIFLRTHYPVTMRRFQNGQLIEIDEAELLEKLLASSSYTPGNRVYILYAAPGSGKSEMMRWLQTQIELRMPQRAAVAIRISRTELDVLSIAERFKHLLSAETFGELTRERWRMVRQKPRTLAKLLVLSALENLLNSDDEINAIYYRLVNAVQPHIERSLGIAAEDNDIYQAELISREVWDNIRAESALAIPIEYEQFRQQMLAYFRHHLLEGLDLRDTLHHISTKIQQAQGQRPILLVDDLVQSLNLFATDLLDYFVTLEAGNWDVVLGLTPAAFETNQRGRELLQRIAYLDTIDDRVEKLWLSDEIGQDSYVLTEANCHQFIVTYLAEYQRLNGLDGQSSLFPFNREVLVRIYRGLPPNKGKARYFLRHIRSILHQVAQGEPLLVTVAKFARTEFVARCDDPALAAVCELFGPLLTDDTVREVTLPAELLNQFDLRAEETAVSVEPLLKLKLHREAITQVVDDEEKAAVRDWLLGREVNRQLLRPLRQGLARLLRRIAPPDLFHRPGIARPSGTLHWRKPFLGIQPPICLEGVDAEGEGIRVSREIGLLAFDLHRYASAKGREAKALEASLAAEPDLLPFFFGAADYQRQLVINLEQQLGLPLETLALGLYSWGLAYLAPADGVIPLPLRGILPSVSSAHLTSRREQQVTAWQDWKLLFDDFFKLRENLYDGGRLTYLTQQAPLECVFDDILNLDTRQIDKAFRWRKRLLSSAINEWQTLMGQAIELDGPAQLSSQTQQWMARIIQAGDHGELLAELPEEIVAELAHNSPSFYHRLRVRVDS